MDSGPWQKQDRCDTTSLFYRLPFSSTGSSTHPPVHTKVHGLHRESLLVHKWSAIVDQGCLSTFCPRPSLLAKRSRRLSAGYIWTNTGAQGSWLPANRKAHYPARGSTYGACAAVSMGGQDS